jgi:hypothetical protein
MRLLSLFLAVIICGNFASISACKKKVATTEAESENQEIKFEQVSAEMSATQSNVYVVSGSGTGGGSAWTTLQGVTSQTSGGTVRQSTASGKGTRSATWSISGITPGYYKIEILYPMKSDNASCVQVLTKSTLDQIYIARPTKLDQTRGTGISKSSTVFTNTKTNMTPFNSTNANSYIWVEKSTTSKTGSLSVQIRDAGCSSGRMVADTVVLSLISTTK